MFERITDSDISTRSIASLANTPNRRTPYGESDMSAAKLKERFDLLPTHIAVRLNEIFDGMKNGELADAISVKNGNSLITLGNMVRSLISGDVENINVKTVYETISLAAIGAFVVELRNTIQTGELADKIMVSESRSIKQFYDELKDAGKYDLSFNGEYNPDNNPVATVQTVVDKLAELVANAPEDLNTLKEIADYIASDKTGAAAINSKLSQHDRKFEEITGEISSAQILAFSEFIKVQNSINANSDGIKALEMKHNTDLEAVEAALDDVHQYAQGLLKGG